MMPKNCIAAAVLISTLLGVTSSSNAVETAYVAKPAYSVLVAGVSVPVDLANIPRGFDFSGNAPFVNPFTNVSDIATINYFDPVANAGAVLNSTKIKALNGAPDRVFKIGPYTAVGYRKGDGLVEGTLRTMMTSFPIPSRKKLVWNLVFKLAGATPTTPWTFTTKGTSPATLWQIKSANIPPALVMTVDTDPKDATSLQLMFDERPIVSQPAFRVADIGGLKPNTDITVRIELSTDERPVSAGGDGFLRITVNGTQILNSIGPVLQGGAVLPYQWALAMYLFNNKTPLNFDRFGLWRTAQMSVVDD